MREIVKDLFPAVFMRSLFVDTQKNCILCNDSTNSITWGRLQSTEPQTEFHAY